MLFKIVLKATTMWGLRRQQQCEVQEGNRSITSVNVNKTICTADYIYNDCDQILSIIASNSSWSKDQLFLFTPHMQRHSGEKTIPNMIRIDTCPQETLEEQNVL